ncbi:MAG: metallopeptidase family protein [Pseudomonadota bacterium]
MAPAVWRDAAPPDLAALMDLALAARAQLPPPFRTAAAEVQIVVEEWPADPVLAELDIDDPRDLTGLYEGTPLTERSFDAPDGPARVTLFRRPILDEWAERGTVSLRALVTHIVVHEFAHHFGWSDGDIATIDEWWT